MNEVNFLNSSEGNNALPLYCVCCLDYGSFPIILLHSLPTKVQRLIINRLTRSNLPQFILTTHKGGQWSLVQLHYISNNEDNNDDNSKAFPSSVSSQNESHLDNSSDRSSLLKDFGSKLRSHVCTNYISSIEFNVDPYTTAYFSDSYVKFMLKAKVPDRNWHCPFCKADYSLISGDQVNVLERHLRLHTEIRCCMDCVTILPNSTYSLDCESAYIHDCNKLVSSQAKNDYQQPRSAYDSNDLPQNIMDLPEPSSKLSSVSNLDFIYINECNDQIDRSDELSALQSDNNKIQLQKCDVPSNCTSKTSSFAYVSAGHWRRICTKCKVGFKTSAQYQQHLKNVHRGKKFFCQDCGTFFSTKGNLTTHFNQVHNQNASAPCSVCGKYFSNRFNLDRHMRSVHADYEISSNSLSLKMNTVPVSDVSLIKNESNEDTHQSNTTVVPSFKEPTRGYFLYLSDSDCHQSPNINASTSVIDSTKNKQSVLELTSATVGSRSISLVADVSLTPCLPSNPDAQLGIGGKTWKENIDIVQSPKSIEFNNVDSC
ncbi:Zinc finger protein [Schistosoma japonicum]|uniref:Zinc finger protein n=1 Tax=Schistosoma japonicum TaxID=6182 RepID=A0A4Z2CN74_SCHJA|nr:Zinc finger protein [Schistosoma japonicum]